MALAKLKELKDQLKDLVDKGFIRPSVLPWVLHVLREKELYAKFSKCEFWLSSVAFLGHIISNSGIMVDTQKIEVVKTWPRSMTPTKDMLTSTPVLALPEGSEGYVVYCNASGFGLGCVLMQHGKVITYVSRQLRKYEKNYSTHDLEFAAVVPALKIWRHCLYGIHVDIFTDHKSFQYIFRQKELNLLSYLSVEKRELARKLHQLASLGVRLLEADDSGVTIQDTSVSSLVVEEIYWWHMMKKNVSEFVAQCPNCQQVKVEHQKPAGLVQEIAIPLWKWEAINMDFITGLPQMRRKFDSIWVNLSTAFHPQTDGQAEHIILTLEDMLRACALDFKGSWDDHLLLIEFTYNNNYHSNIGMTPYEALYG
ncbi:uncharacterized protein LOC125826254 [Solanum verrucosum]|uniref:uncharacterized protein LOC125826254 n=1 Tax=Solanum verrucosum TaxID=315347 RepID=UPI0020D01704|nr:uncharacterized protein LOC125826254 [Solanum verrucosum]